MNVLRVVRIKLVNWEEGNYKVTDKPRPRGEIIIGKAKMFFRLVRSEALYKLVCPSTHSVNHPLTVVIFFGLKLNKKKVFLRN